MRRGYQYRHVSAPDICILVLKTFHIKPGVILVKCGVFNTWFKAYYETLSFRVNSDDLWKWELYNACQK